MKRKKVYKAIDTEREYQIQRTDDSSHDHMIPLDVGSTLSAIRYNLQMAEQEWYYESPESHYRETMKYLRKVAGLIVQMGEKHGMPEREL